MADEKDADLITGSQIVLRPRILSAKNYYSFGMAIQKPGTAGSHYDYGFRSYDASLARFFAVDFLRMRIIVLFASLLLMSSCGDSDVNVYELVSELRGQQIVFNKCYSELMKVDSLKGRWGVICLRPPDTIKPALRVQYPCLRSIFKSGHIKRILFADTCNVVYCISETGVLNKTDNYIVHSTAIVESQDNLIRLNDYTAISPGWYIGYKKTYIDD